MTENLNKPVHTFILTSSAFTNNGMIPPKYTCDGKNLSPALQWSDVPNGTKTFALIVDDPDAPTNVWVHWVMFNIPATMRELPEGIQSGEFIQGSTDFPGKKEYGGPCPPTGTHRYHFTLYALDINLDLPAGASKENVLSAIKGHVLGQAKLIGLYKKK